jgi:hypothetical protein
MFLAPYILYVLDEMQAQLFWLTHNWCTRMLYAKLSMFARIVSTQNSSEHYAAFDPLVDSFDSDDYKLSRSVTHHLRMDDKKTFA